MDLLALISVAALAVFAIGPFNRFIDRWNQRDSL
jgi:hypothetical protein